MLRNSSTMVMRMTLAMFTQFWTPALDVLLATLAPTRHHVTEISSMQRTSIQRHCLQGLHFMSKCNNWQIFTAYHTQVQPCLRQSTPPEASRDLHNDWLASRLPHWRQIGRLLRAQEGPLCGMPCNLSCPRHRQCLHELCHVCCLSPHLQVRTASGEQVI